MGWGTLERWRHARQVHQGRLTAKATRRLARQAEQGNAGPAWQQHVWQAGYEQGWRAGWAAGYQQALANQHRTEGGQPWPAPTSGPSTS